MTSSIRSIRKRLLECLERRELEKLSHREDAGQRGRPMLIEYILDNWTVECDDSVQNVVNISKHKPKVFSG